MEIVDSMRFYYVSSASLVLLAVIYLVGTGLLVWLGYWLRKQWRYAWLAMVPLFLLLYVGPIAEELWIAWNFGQLCKKDAGLFVYKTVEVEGFYDATMRSGFENIEKGGYRFMEHPSRDRARVEHVEKVNGEWVATVLDHPTARYQYMWPHMDTPMSHKVDKIERVVVDSELDEVLARETKYRRQAPWFFVGLDRPVMLCPAPGEDPLSQYGSVFNLALKPKKDR